MSIFGKGKPYMTGVLNKFLETATWGRVVAEFAIATNRWRLVCHTCQQTLTFAELYDLEEEYAKTGRLDEGVQNFARAHTHFAPSQQKATIVDWPPKLGQGEAFKAFQEQKKYQNAIAAEQLKAEKQAYDNVLAIKELQAQWVAKQEMAILTALSKEKEVAEPTLVSTLRPLPKPRKTEGRKFR